MFRLVYIGGPFGDNTSRYDVIFDREYTVREFLNAIIQKGNEWGNVSFWSDQTETQPYKRYSCYYKYNRLYGDIPEEWLGQKIKSATANGGWSNMDYSVKLCGSEDKKKMMNPEKAIIIQKFSRILEQSNAVQPTGMAPKQLAPGVRAYTTTQTFSGITIDFNMLAKDVYESGVLKEDGWDA